MQDNIPFFEDERNRPVPGKPTVERDAIIAIIFDPREEKFLCLDWPKFGWHTFPMGGIEPGETPVEAAIREIREELGYTQLKFIKELCKTRSSYYAAHKNENRLSNETVLLFELLSQESVEISEEERAKHDIVWIPKSELTTWIVIAPQLYMANKALEVLQ